VLASVAAFSTTVLVAGCVAGLWPVPSHVLRLLGASPAAADTPGSFARARSTHHDGDAIRCGVSGRSMRYYAVDAPKMPGACRPGRRCTPGDPCTSRDHLAGLTAGKDVTCRQRGTDHFGRRVVQCFAASVELSCRVVAEGFLVEQYGRLEC
jgi:endonuclease YncB( thermonuclease family)